MQNNFGYDRFVNYQDLQNTTKYIVKSGDSLYSIASQYNTTPNELINLNKLSSTMIYPNQVLFVPKKVINTPFKEYLTINGDSVNRIITKANINLKQFEKYNNINDLELAPNQVIKIYQERDCKFYTVKADEDLNSILKANDITALELIELNKMQWLKPGVKIIVG